MSVVFPKRVKTIAKSGSTGISGDATLTGGTNITLTQAGQDISIAASGGAVPGGLDTHVQFNDASSFGGDAGMTYNKTTDTLTLAGNLQAEDILIEDSNASHYLTITTTSDLTAARTLTLVPGDASRTVTLSGNLTIVADFITSGANSLTLTTTGATNVTLPTAGTLTTTSNTLAAFAATTSAQLAGVISDETGSGLLVFGTSPVLTTPTIGSFTNATHIHQAASSGGTLDHGLALTGLTDDDHGQYALLAGRSGGQIVIGGTAAGQNLTLQSTSNATRGKIILGSASAYDEVNDRIGIGTTSPTYTIDAQVDQNSGTEFRVQNAFTGASAFAEWRLTNDTGDIGFVFVTSSIWSAPALRNSFVIGSSSLADSMNIYAGKVGTPIVFYTDGTVAANERVRFSATEAVFNDNSNDVDFRVESDTSTHCLFVDAGTNTVRMDGDIDHNGTNIGFFSATPTTKPTVAGSRGGNAALASLLTALAGLGLLTDSTTA